MDKINVYDKLVDRTLRKAEATFTTIAAESLTAESTFVLKT